MTTVIYLHGFSSSPHGTKARTLRTYVESRGATFLAPDLNVPTFETLTVTAMLETVDTLVRSITDDPIYLIGSSLGGFAALHYLSRYRDGSAAKVSKLLLLAPAIIHKWENEPYFDEWQRDGVRTVPHFGYGGEDRNLHFGFVTDHMSYDSSTLQPKLPIHIIHGENDDIVPLQISQDFVQQHPDVVLQAVNSDHQMHDQLTTIQDVMATFFELG